MIGSIRKPLGLAIMGALALLPTPGSCDEITPAVTAGSKKLPLEGRSFRFEGRDAFVIAPSEAQSPVPWVWYAPTLPGLPDQHEKWLFERFLKAGVAIAGIDVGESYGNPKGRGVYRKFHEYLVDEKGFSKTPCLLARSRGGLMLYNWAVEHPGSVSGIAGIYPVCNIASYPGIERAAAAYGMTTDRFSDRLSRHNPIDRLMPLAEARVPLFHIHGDEDGVVPLEENSGELAARYRALGGAIRLDIVEGRGHDTWPGWFRSEEMADFIIARAKGG